MTVPSMSRRAGAVPGSRSAWDPEPSSGPAPGERRPSAQTASYPHRSHLVLGALSGAVPCARLHARLVLVEWGLKALAESAELVVSELITNAVRTSAGLPEAQHSLPIVRMWLSADHERVLVQVWDADHQLPVPQQPDPEAEHGRGLLLVESLSEATIHRQDRLGHPALRRAARCSFITVSALLFGPAEAADATGNAQAPQIQPSAEAAPFRQGSPGLQASQRRLPG